MKKYTAADLLGQLLSAGKWIMFPKELLSIMNVTQALLLAFLISVYHRAKRKNMDHNNWFYCKESRIKAELCMAHSTQLLNFKQLEEVGYIKRIRKGNKGKRYIWINFGAILRDMTSRSNYLISDDMKAFLNSKDFKEPEFIRRPPRGKK